MRLDLKAMAYAGGALWGSAVLLVGLINVAQPMYGAAFLQSVVSVYPGYHATPSVGSALIGTGYALLDGAVGGWLFGWLYNRAARRPA